MKNMNHNWGTIQRLASDRQGWRSFVAALYASRCDRLWWWWCLHALPDPQLQPSRITIPQPLKVGSASLQASSINLKTRISSKFDMCDSHCPPTLPEPSHASPAWSSISSFLRLETEQFPVLQPNCETVCLTECSSEDTCKIKTEDLPVFRKFGLFKLCKKDSLTFPFFLFFCNDTPWACSCSMDVSTLYKSSSSPSFSLQRKKPEFPIRNILHWYN